jgi:protein gp37
VWDRKAKIAGIRNRVFCASLADVFDNQVPEEWRMELWSLIFCTPNLDWQLLTKRPQNIAKMLPAQWGIGWDNVWLGTTVENQQEADRRIPHLLDVPARVHFLSCEPLLGPVSLRAWMDLPYADGGTAWNKGKISWVICGGESGNNARIMHPTWAMSLLAQCKQAGVPAWFKQTGSAHYANSQVLWAGQSGKGDDPAKWQECFRVQEMPHA